MWPGRVWEIRKWWIRWELACAQKHGTIFSPGKKFQNAFLHSKYFCETHFQRPCLSLSLSSMSSQKLSEQLTNRPLSVTRLGEIPPLWQIFTHFGNIFKAYLVLVQNCILALAQFVYFWANFHCCNLAKYWKHIMFIWSHCRRLCCKSKTKDPNCSLMGRPNFIQVIFCKMVPHNEEAGSVVKRLFRREHFNGRDFKGGSIVSVTRLGEFWKILATNFLAKVAQIFFNWMRLIWKI